MFYEILESDLVIHRHKVAISLSLGKLLIGTWVEEDGFAKQLFARAIEIMKKGQFGLGVYLFQSLMGSCPEFKFPVSVKEHMLVVYLE